MASPPTRVLAGITVPDTPLITKALAYAKSHCNEVVYNHVVRSWLFGAYTANHLSVHPNWDTELHAVAAILHDLGLATTPGFISADKRFEVDGANLTRAFLQAEGNEEEWDQYRLQLAWDAVALHTTSSIAKEMQAEVRNCCLGIMTDFLRPDNAPGGPIPGKVWNGIVKEFPRHGFREGVKDALCGLCVSKPETTYDNFVADFGTRFVDGYSVKGKLAIDFILAAED
ncbi:hypothetical protein B0O99DRAFT_631827 [Bisporella sp. PMI_857]|nr:hypothetical protein B0O99DRAFT_631827 [Bisporella sp. PMI_857]